MNRLAAILAVTVVAAAHAQDKIVKVDGSSTVYPIIEAVAEEFQSQTRVKVTVGISGTGGGFKKFCRAETDISNASRPILASEIEEAKKHNVEYLELPIAFDALTVVVNKENTWVNHMTVDELRKIWEPAAQGKITKWNQVRPEWPDARIELYGAGTDSGTFDYFTEAIVGKAKSSRGDYIASEDDNTLVRGVEGNKYALGYFGFAYYAAHAGRLKAVPIQWDGNKVKDPVAPSEKTVIDGTYNPLSRPLFVYVNKQSLETKPHVRQFVEFLIGNGRELVAEVKYVPLPSDAQELVHQRFARRETGTAFAGEPAIGVPIHEILKRPLHK
jgi:phosphate transport system substrate-binding protein